MFLGFANFYRYIIKDFSKIAAPLILILETIALLTADRPTHTKTKENEFYMRIGSNINGDRIDDKILNLSSSTKKMSFGANLLTFEASLVFT